MTEENRIYAVIRDDLPFSEQEYMRIAAEGYMGLAELCNAIPELIEDYHSGMQPKLVLRAKNGTVMQKAIDALEREGIQFVKMHDENSVTGVFIVPYSRNLLPREISSLQLFSERRNSSESVNKLQEPENAGSELTLIYRSELKAPLGKMMAQAGHAIWASSGIFENRFISASFSLLPVNEKEWKETEIELFSQQDTDSGIITDSGRTVFSEPTPTFIWKRNPAYSASNRRP